MTILATAGCGETDAHVPKIAGRTRCSPSVEHPARMTMLTPVDAITDRPAMRPRLGPALPPPSACAMKTSDAVALA